MSAVALAVGLACASAAPSGAAVSYRSFDAPDTSLVPRLRAAGTDYENAWNALLVASLRARLARADSAARLDALARRVAGAEPVALGSHLAADALALARRWKPAERRLRVEAAVTESLAIVARGARQWDAADSLYRSALSGYRALRERRREAWVLGGIGVVALGAGRSEQALAVYGEALAARRALGDPRLLGNTLNDLGQTCFQLERYAEARRWLVEAADVRARAGFTPGLAATLGFLGSTLVALGERDSAERCFGEALALTSASGDSARTLLTLVNYGAMLMDRGEAERSTALFQRARGIALEAGDAERLFTIDMDLATTARMRGRFTEASERFRDAAAWAAGSPASLAIALNGLGEALASMGDAERARAPLARALALADSLDDGALAARALVNQSLVSEALGVTDGARRLAERAVQRAVAAGDSLRVREAAHRRAQIDLGDARGADALPWIDRAITAMPASGWDERAALLVNRGVALHLQNRLDEAVPAYQVALALADSAGAADLALSALTDLGDIAERRSDWPAAFARYGEAVARVDSIRAHQAHGHDAVKAMAERVYVYEALIHLLARLDAVQPDSGYATRAFALAERSRARGLLDLAAAGGRAVPAPIASPDDARGALASDREALLEYSVGDSSTTLWAVRRSGWRMLQLPARRILTTRIQLARQALADPAADETRRAKACRALYRLLLEPAEPLLAGADRLVISPSGPLALVPFEALLARDPGPGGPAVADYVAARYVVRYTPSASALTLPAAGGNDRGVIAAGDPTFMVAGGDTAAIAARGLVPLPNTAMELATLERCAGGRPLTVLAGARATAGHVLGLPGLERAALLHFATHGDVNEAEPERSGLWFAPDSGQSQPSRIEVADVLRLALRADLVSLSACETGLGRLERGEGIVGLQRAFLAAGARSVLVSLWRVNDRSTARLMDAFYRRALVAGEDRATALAAAKRALLADPATRSPFYWAPFVLVGDPGGSAGSRARR